MGFEIYVFRRDEEFVFRVSRFCIGCFLDIVVMFLLIVGFVFYFVFLVVWVFFLDVFFFLGLYLWGYWLR